MSTGELRKPFLRHRNSGLHVPSSSPKDTQSAYASLSRGSSLSNDSGRQQQQQQNVSLLLRNKSSRFRLRRRSTTVALPLPAIRPTTIQQDHVARLPSNSNMTKRLMVSILRKPFAERTDIEIQLLTDTLEKLLHLQVRFKSHLQEGEKEVDISLKEVCRSLEYQVCQMDEYVVREGEPGEYFYWIWTGSARVEKRKPGDEMDRDSPHVDTVAILHPGSYFGELALIYNAPRAASVVCRETTELLLLHKSCYSICMEKAHSTQIASRRRLLDHCLPGLSDRVLHDWAACMIPLDVHKNNVLLQQGDVSTGLFLIENGIVQVYRKETVTETKPALFDETTSVLSVRASFFDRMHSTGTESFNHHMAREHRPVKPDVVPPWRRNRPQPKLSYLPPELQEAVQTFHHGASGAAATPTAPTTHTPRKRTIAPAATPPAAVPQISVSSSSSSFRSTPRSSRSSSNTSGAQVPTVPPLPLTQVGSDAHPTTAHSSRTNDSSTTSATTSTTSITKEKLFQVAILTNQHMFGIEYVDTDLDTNYGYNRIVALLARPSTYSFIAKSATSIYLLPEKDIKRVMSAEIFNKIRKHFRSLPDPEALNRIIHQSQNWNKYVGHQRAGRLKEMMMSIFPFPPPV